MADRQTTFAVQRYLDEFAGVTGDTPAEPLIRSLIERSLTDFICCAARCFNEAIHDWHGRRSTCNRTKCSVRLWIGY